MKRKQRRLKQLQQKREQRFILKEQKRKEQEHQVLLQQQEKRRQFQENLKKTDLERAIARGVLTEELAIQLSQAPLSDKEIEIAKDYMRIDLQFGKDEETAKKHAVHRVWLNRFYDLQSNLIARQTVNGFKDRYAE